MPDKENQNMYSAPSDTHSDSWNKKANEFSWNAASLNFFSEVGLNSRNQVHTVTKHPILDVKQITRKEFDNMQNTLYALEQSEEVPYLGPNAINDSIFANQILGKIKANKIVSFFAKNLTRQKPYWYYKYYMAFSKFLECYSSRFNIPIESIDDKELLRKERFFEIVESSKIQKLGIRHIPYLVKLYHSASQETHYRIKNNVINWELKHSLIDRHLTAFKGYKLKSLRERKRAYYKFLIWLHRTHTSFNSYPLCELPLWLVRQEHIENFRLFLEREIKTGIIKDSHASYILDYVKSLFRSLYQTGHLLSDITNGVPGIFYERYNYRDIPSDEEIDRLFSVIMIFSPDPAKYALAIEMMLYLGLRKTEVSEIRWEGINLYKQSISITGKWGKTHTLPIPSNVLERLNIVSEETNNGYVFSPEPTKFAQSLYEYVKIFTLMADWSYSGDLHLLRHTMITKLSYRSDCPPQLLRLLSRHTKDETTALYIHRSIERLRDAVNKLTYFM